MGGIVTVALGYARAPERAGAKQECCGETKTEGGEGADPCACFLWQPWQSRSPPARAA